MTRLYSKICKILVIFKDQFDTLSLHSPKSFWWLMVCQVYTLAWYCIQLLSHSLIRLDLYIAYDHTLQQNMLILYILVIFKNQFDTVSLYCPKSLDCKWFAMFIGKWFAMFIP